MDGWQVLTIIASLSGLFIAGATCAFQIIIKFNDLTHMEKGQNEIKATLAAIDKKLDTNAERISKIEGKCLANHG